MAKCYKCGWEGEDDKLVERPGNLIFYDYVAINTLGMDITRADFHCPTCGEMLRSKRMSNGMAFDK